MMLLRIIVLLFPMFACDFSDNRGNTVRKCVDVPARGPNPLALLIETNSSVNLTCYSGSWITIVSGIIGPSTGDCIVNTTEVVCTSDITNHTGVTKCNGLEECTVNVIQSVLACTVQNYTVAINYDCTNESATMTIPAGITQTPISPLETTTVIATVRIGNGPNSTTVTDSNTTPTFSPTDNDAMDTIASGSFQSTISATPTVTPSSRDNEDIGSTVVIITLSVVIGVLLIVTLIAVICIFRWRRNKKYKANSQNVIHISEISCSVNVIDNPYSANPSTIRNIAVLTRNETGAESSGSPYSEICVTESDDRTQAHPDISEENFDLGYETLGKSYSYRNADSEYSDVCLEDGASVTVVHIKDGSDVQETKKVRMKKSTIIPRRASYDHVILNQCNVITLNKCRVGGDNFDGNLKEERADGNEHLAKDDTEHVDEISSTLGTGDANVSHPDSKSMSIEHSSDTDEKLDHAYFTHETEQSQLYSSDEVKLSDCIIGFTIGEENSCSPTNAADQRLGQCDYQTKDAYRDGVHEGSDETVNYDILNKVVIFKNKDSPSTLVSTTSKQQEEIEDTYNHLLGSTTKIEPTPEVSSKVTLLPESETVDYDTLEMNKEAILTTSFQTCKPEDQNRDVCRPLSASTSEESSNRHLLPGHMEVVENGDSFHQVLEEVERGTEAVADLTVKSTGDLPGESVHDEDLYNHLNRTSQTS